MNPPHAFASQLMTVRPHPSCIPTQRVAVCTGTWGFVELGSAACIDAVVKGQAESNYPTIHISGITHWLVLSTSTVPVPAYAISTTAAASMSLLRADQRPKYNHATNAQNDQSGAVPLSGPLGSAAARPEGVATMYPTSGPYPGYGHGYGMFPLCIGHSCIHTGCVQQSELAGTHMTHFALQPRCCGRHQFHL